MLRKLLKYDFLASYKLLFSLYALTLILSIINRLLSESSLNFVQMFASLTMFLLVILLITTFAMTFFVVIVRYYKNLYCDEGYLMNTLPVKASNLVYSKLITSIFFTVISLITIVASICILIIGTSMEDGVVLVFSNLLNELSSVTNVNSSTLAIFILIYIAFGVFSYIAYFFAAVSIGQLLPMNKILGSFIGVIILNVINQAVSFTILGVGSVIYKIDMFTTNSVNTLTPNLGGYLKYTFIGMTAMLIILSVCYIIFSNIVLKKKLNLE